MCEVPRIARSVSLHFEATGDEFCILVVFYPQMGSLSSGIDSYSLRRLDGFITYMIDLVIKEQSLEVGTVYLKIHAI